MECPQCQTDSLRVIDSRDVEAEPAIRRRRECERCGFRFTTYERIETPLLSVVKKDGHREPFSREKLARGIRRACEKRPVSETALERVIIRSEQEIRSQGEAEVAVRRIGEAVMRHLKKLDHIAYIRFASVYREFADLSELDAEIKKVLGKQEKVLGKQDSRSRDRQLA
ncbi:MAG: transcriptional regulator NrdR [Patescibacteria group bacterium]